MHYDTARTTTRATPVSDAPEEGHDRYLHKLSTVWLILERCPAVTDLNIPLVDKVEKFELLTARLVEQCPNLCRITQRHSETDDFDAFDMDREGTVSAAVMKLWPGEHFDRFQLPVV